MELLLINLTATIFGLLLGNYATTAFYRLPRNITVSGFAQNLTEPPFCSLCHHKLEFWEYLPVLSWISTCGSCNYCHKKIDISYTILEVSLLFLSLILVNVLGLSEKYIILLLFCASTLSTVFICLYHDIIPRNCAVVLLMLGAIYFTLLDGTTSNWIIRMTLSAILAISLMKHYRFFFYHQSYISLIMVSSMWISHILSLIICILMLVVFYLLTSCFDKNQVLCFNNNFFIKGLAKNNKGLLILLLLITVLLEQL